MIVLIHRSHCSATKPDGWSGAPGEAAWVRNLVPRIQAGLMTLGIEVVVVDGDLEDHPEFHRDYDAFIAPHYEAEVHGMGGSFWGRASASTTPSEDDRLGNLFWAKFQAIPGAPAPHFEWSNPNVTDYYGFRLTSTTTPGILVEHGVGAPGAPDHDWLRANAQKIADVWVESLAEFGGIKMPLDPNDPVFVAYQQDVAASFEAVKAELAKQAHHQHQTGEPE